jgi:hypothetical protein
MQVLIEKFSSMQNQFGSRFVRGAAVCFFLSTIALEAQDFALISESTAHAVQTKVNTPAGRATVSAADGALSRSPHPIEKIQMEGKLPHDPIYDRSKEADADLSAMADLAFAYRLTGDRKYLDAVMRFLHAWIPVYQTEGNPINDQDFYFFFMAIDLVHSDLPAETRQQASAFALHFAKLYLDEIEKEYAAATKAVGGQDAAKPDPTSSNNFQSHRIKTGALAAFLSGDRALIERARLAFERQISLNIYPDGTVLDFRQRDAIDYVTYDLDPLLLTALAASAHGQSWFAYKSPSGSSLGGALDWLIPYAQRKKTHDEFANTTVPFDITRRKAGVPGFSGIWQPKAATSTFSLASALDPKYRSVRDDLEMHENTRTPRFIDLAF